MICQQTNVMDFLSLISDSQLVAILVKLAKLINKQLKPNLTQPSLSLFKKYSDHTLDEFCRDFIRNIKFRVTSLCSIIYAELLNVYR